MTVFVQQRLLDADAACERAEELIDRHKVECEYVGSILERAIAELGAVEDGGHILGSPFYCENLGGLIADMRRALPPDYERDHEAMIELSALAHQRAMKEMEW